MINIPKQYWNLATFRATRGHKHNHSFKQNKVEFTDTAYHPRYGKIAAVVATRDIKKGEEIFAYYGYGAGGPDWYKDLHMKEMGFPLEC